MDADTVVTMNKIEPARTEFGLDKGKLFCILEGFKGGSKFEVRTPTAICGSKGTGFSVKHNPVTTASCFEHNIYFQQTGKDGKPSGDEYVIKEGFKKVIGRDFVGPDRKLSSQEKNKWKSWKKSVGTMMGNNPPAEGSSSKGDNNVTGDTDNIGDNLDDSQEDAVLDKESDQDSQGAEKRRQDSLLDSDGDGVLDSDDLYPNDSSRASGNDLDGDGIDDEFDSDIDGDGYLNTADTYPRDYYDYADSDGDGIRNNEDAFISDAVIHDDSSVKGYGSRHEIRQKILNLIEIGSLRDDIAQHTTDMYWRDMDARLTQRADAQMHKVMTDREGNRVRVEQYILRPNSKKIQILDINLRTNDASNQSREGLTTLSWLTTFNRDIEGDEVNELPWSDYLNVFDDSGTYKITSTDTTYYQVGESNSKLAYPTKMEIDLAHNDDSIEETVFFADRVYDADWRQQVSGYELKVNGTVEFNTITACYAATSTTTDGFIISISGSHNLVADFFVINNSGAAIADEYTFNDIRDMLKVGYFSLTDGTNLECVFNCGDVFSAPIDIIITPMKDSNWEKSIDWTNWTQHAIE